MKEEPLISIVVPIHNVEKYLRQCLDSIVNQTYKNIEIILVNDKSPDNSIKIMQEYAKKDNRIIIIENEKNLGLSGTRNVGIEEAKGEYISFIDSDDWVDKDYIKNLYDSINQYSSDLAIGAISCFNERKQQLIVKEAEDIYFSLLEYKKDNIDTLEKEEILKNVFILPVMAWGKLWKASIIKENNLKFPEKLNYEDNPFFIEYILLCNKASLVFSDLYFYRINRFSSIVYQRKSYKDIISILEKIDDILKKYQEKDELVEKYEDFKIFCYERFLYRNSCFSINFIKELKKHLQKKDLTLFPKLQKKFRIIIKYNIVIIIIYYYYKYIILKMKNICK